MVVWRGEVVTRVEDLDRWRAPWDELAVDSALPFSAPVWMLGWWRHAAPNGAALRVVLVHAGDELVGVGPFFAVRSAGVTRYRLLGAPMSMRTEPVARGGCEAEVAQTIARTLAAAGPPPDIVALEGVSRASGWPVLLGSAWPERRHERRPGRPSGRRSAAGSYLDVSRPAPAVTLAGRTFDEWLAAKSRNFRQQMGRARRRAEERGASFRQAGEDEVPAMVARLASLHEARWRSRGGWLVRPAIQRALVQAGRDLGGSRFRLWCMEAAGRAVSVQLFVAAGGEVGYWLGGFDQGWEAERPGMLTLLAAIEAAFDAGDRRVDLGGGAQPYKHRLADCEDALDWTYLVPPSPRSLLAHGALLPRRAYRALAARLPEGSLDRVKRLARRP